ncbi:hypothetical protein D3C77_804620 [compost metagenome]
MAIHHFGRRLTNNDEAHDDGLLGTLVIEEIFFTQAFDKDQRIAGSLSHMFNVITKTMISHTGRA